MRFSPNTPNQTSRLVPVLLGGIGTIGGYFVTSESSALLQPFFGWRIMWLLGFPTGIILIALSPLLPESARFLVHMGRFKEAEEMLARYGSAIIQSPANAKAKQDGAAAIIRKDVFSTRSSLRPLLGLVVALTLAALAWGLVNFGVLLWLPGSLMATGRSMGLASTIWNSSLGGAPAVADGVVYIVGNNGVSALNATTGALLWNYVTASTVETRPAVANGVVYVGSDDGTIYAFGLTSGIGKKGLSSK